MQGMEGSHGGRAYFKPITVENEGPQVISDLYIVSRCNIILATLSRFGASSLQVFLRKEKVTLVWFFSLFLKLENPVTDFSKSGFDLIQCQLHLSFLRRHTGR